MAEKDQNKTGEGSSIRQLNFLSSPYKDHNDEWVSGLCKKCYPPKYIYYRGMTIMGVQSRCIVPTELSTFLRLIKLY